MNKRKRQPQSSDDDTSCSSSDSEEEEEKETEEDEETETYTIPNTLKLKVGGEGIADVSFHPVRDLLAVSTTGGRIRLYDCSEKEDAEHIRSCGGRWHKGGRAVRFSPGAGERLYSASSQGGVKCHDVETGGKVFSRLNAHSAPVSSLLVADEHKVVSGCEDGEIKLWDTRMAEGCAFSLNLVDEEVGEELLEPGVNGLALDADRKHLLVAADDGCLRTVSLRGKRKLLCTSEPLGYSARNVCLMKNERKTVVGTEEGVLNLFNKGEWGNLSDRFPVIRKTRDDSRVIEAMVKVSEEVIVVGAEDGVMRAVRLLPNRTLGEVGRHQSGPKCLCDGLSMTTSPSGLFLASGCLETSEVQFWPIQHLVDAGKEEAENLKRGRKKQKNSELPIKRRMVEETDARRAFLRDLT